MPLRWTLKRPYFPSSKVEAGAAIEYFKGCADMKIMASEDKQLKKT